MKGMYVNFELGMSIGIHICVPPQLCVRMLSASSDPSFGNPLELVSLPERLCYLAVLLQPPKVWLPGRGMIGRCLFSCQAPHDFFCKHSEPILFTCL